MTFIRKLGKDDCPEAARLLACAMGPNPLHVRVFGENEARRELRLRRFFGVLLDHVLAHGHLLGASHSVSESPSRGTERLVGVLGLIEPGRCRPNLPERLALGARILSTMPPATVWSVRHWLGAWERLDPELPHWHVGPLAVHPEDRRQGIATKLMQAGCELIDTTTAPAWLETDKESNARFYHRFGYSIARQKTVLGVENWFMLRQAGDALRLLRSCGSVCGEGGHPDRQ